MGFPSYVLGFVIHPLEREASDDFLPPGGLNRP
jgi:hypothetical protein